ncbi:MAG: OmpA family protein [Methylococcales bacterium]
MNRPYVLDYDGLDGIYGGDNNGLIKPFGASRALWGTGLLIASFILFYAVKPEIETISGEIDSSMKLSGKTFEANLAIENRKSSTELKTDQFKSNLIANERSGKSQYYISDAYDSIPTQVTPTLSGVVLQHQKKYRSMTRQSTEAAMDKEETVKISEVAQQSATIPLTEKNFNRSLTRGLALSQTPDSMQNEKFPKLSKIQATEIVLSYEFKQTLVKRFPDAEQRVLLSFIWRCKHSIRIVGHTCNLGSSIGNTYVGQIRADSVKDLLVELGLSADRIESISAGENQPVASNDTLAGRVQNRRVEVSCLSDVGT